MRKIICNLLAAFIIPVLTVAQQTECGFVGVDSLTATSLKYFGNNKYLYDKVDEVQQFKQNELLKFNQIITDEYNVQSRSINSICQQTVRYHLPLRIVVHRDANNNNNVNNASIERLVTEMNSRFEESGTNIRFFLMQSPRYIDNSPFAAGDLTDSQIIQMLVAQSNANQFVMHFVSGIDGSAFPPNSPLNLERNCWIGSSWVDRTDVNDNDIEDMAGTMIHELGHSLGLEHTHKPGRWATGILNEDNASVERNCYQESVARRRKNFWYKGCTSTDNMQKCEVNGDFLCDTEADPNMSGGSIEYNDDPNFTNSSGIAPCDYRLAESGIYRVDGWNELWRPNARNIMAYANRRCRNFFSEGQKGIMYDNTTNAFSNNITNIVGSTSISCNGGVYAYNVRGIWGATYSWTATSGLSIVSGQGSASVTVRGNASNTSSQMLSLRVTTNYGTFCFNKAVNLSVPSSGGYISGSSSMASSQTSYFYAYGFGSGNSYNWNVSGTGWQILSQSGNYAQVRSGSTGGSVGVRVSNSCGSTYKYKYVNVSGGGDDCDMMYRISENPTERYLKIIPVDPCLEEPNRMNLSNNEEPFNYKIFNKYGKHIAEGALNKDLELDLTAYEAGYYRIKVRKGNKLILNESFIKQ